MLWGRSNMTHLSEAAFTPAAARMCRNVQRLARTPGRGRHGRPASARASVNVSENQKPPPQPKATPCPRAATPDRVSCKLIEAPFSRQGSKTGSRHARCTEHRGSRGGRAPSEASPRRKRKEKSSMEAPVPCQHALLFPQNARPVYAALAPGEAS